MRLSSDNVYNPSGDTKGGSLSYHWGLIVTMFLVIALPSAVISEIRFTEVTDGVVVNHGGISAGVAWGDYDNDGRPDMFVTNWQNQLNFRYHNDGGTFTDVSGDPSVLTQGYSSGVSWGDYDNDGYLDLFVANQAGQANPLFHNSGDGSFTQVGAEGGDIITGFGDSYSSAWGDYDNDGYLDLIVANSNSQANYLYHNLGDGTFALVTSGPLATDATSSWGVSWCDYNNDGWLDLFVANTSSQNNSLYRNNGDGTFAAVMSGPVVSDGLPSHGGSWADFDNDGDFDLFVANGPYGGNGTRNRLYRNDGGDNFTELTSSLVSTHAARSGSGTWADFDNDGDLDLFVTNYFQNCYLYENYGTFLFPIINGAIVNRSSYCSGNAAGDFDNDGDLDLFLSNWENQSNYLYRTESGSANWLRIQCIGVTSNAWGIGAKVRIRATISNQSVSQLRQISGGHGHRSQNELVAAFGLGDAQIVDSVIIDWPSGIRDIHTAVAVDRSLLATEGGGLECSGGDTDGDGVPDGCDDCPGFDDAADADSDGVPDGCDLCIGFDDGLDADFDGRPDDCDNCLEDFNPGQEDYDADDVGDICDNCPEDFNPGQEDYDADDVGDICDNCPEDFNPGQEDGNGNDIGDLCDGCCVGRVGDANSSGDDEPTIGDVSLVIDAKFITGSCDGLLACLAEADVNQTGGIDPVCDDITVGDVSALIDYLFITGPATGILPTCL